MTKLNESKIGASFLPHLVSRRGLIAGVAAAGSLAAIRGQGRTQDATPDASPVASPFASPVASPIATPVGPEMIGNLRVVRDQITVYSSEPERSGPLVMVRVGKQNKDFNPASFAQDFQIPTSYLEPLVWIDGVTLEPQPWLATGWTWNDDGTAVEFALRDGVLWHDGEKFTARDVEFSFTVYRDDVYSNAYNLFTSMKSVTAVDDLSVRVELHAPDSNWIRNASSQLIFQREQYGSFWDAQPLGERTLAGFDWEASVPTGTGRWIITAVRDSRGQFKRNRAHWAGSPWCSELRLDYVAGEDDQIQRWLDGSADITWPVAPARLPEAGQRAGTAYAAETTGVLFAAFNFNNPARPDPGILADIRIRKALSLGIDRDRYAAEIWSGFFRPRVPGTIVQPQFLLEGIENPTFDPEAARALLEEAGFSESRDDGILRYPDGTALKFDVIVRSGDDPALEALLNGIVADLAQVGVILDVRALSPDRFDTIWIDEHTFDMIAFSYSQYPGFTDFDLYGSDWDIRTNIQGFNPGGYQNAAVNRAIDRALVATNDDVLISALHAIQRQTNDEDLFALWFGSPLEIVVVKDDILGFQPNKVWQGMETERLWRA